MKLQIAQMVLEKAQFEHVGDFLAIEPGPPGPHDVDFELEGLEVAEPGKGAVRLKAACRHGPKYTFSASYLILFAMEEAEDVAELQLKLAATGATMLMPVLREFIANVTGRGRFGPIWLAPINWNEAMAQREAPKSKGKKSRARAKQKA